MNQENKKIHKETIQNWVAFGLMASGIALTVYQYIGAPYITGAGVVIGLFFIIKRTLPKRLSILTIASILCCMYMPISYWLFMTFPGIYGYELEALFSWSISLLGAALAAIVLTSIELFRSSPRIRT